MNDAHEAHEVRGDVVTSYKNAQTRTVTADGVTFAYRDLGPRTGMPVIFITHLAAVLDNWDPRVVDGIAAKHRVITFDNRGVGASTGVTPKTIEEMAKDAVTFIRALGFEQVDVLSFAFGGTIVMQPRFEAQAALRLMLAHDVSFFAGVPTMYWGLLAALDETVDVARLAANLRVAAAGGAALPAEIHKQFKDRFGVTILEGYGLSETSPIASFSRFGEEPRVGSIGVPIPGVEMKLIRDDWSEVKGGADEIGEIAIKGHNVMKGYYKRPEATAEAIREGWFRSGDLARKDEDGFYYIVDRSKDMIIRGGFNVYPREIEDVLMEHPAVSLAAVIGVPHESHGEEIKAVVVKEAGSGTTEDELVAWAKERLAAYKYPRVVQFVDELPLTSTGKILKRRLS
ncbi:alpha/beta fold hydrolase [Streptomyces sp. NPDC006476]|uniref:alpha/beta fold hydrolase n=1 Tax=Streptomyces sp. NPDC006476 TaxID=3157175 RepID=UPI0033B3B7B6